MGHRGITTIRKTSVKAGEDQGQGDLIRRALANRAFHQGNHPVQERFSGAAGDFHHDPVGQDDGAAGDAGAVAALFPDDRRAFAGYRRLIDGGDPFDNISVAGDCLSRLDDDPVAGPQSRGGDLFNDACRIQTIGHRVMPRPPERIGLGLAARLGEGSGEIGEQAPSGKAIRQGR